MAVSKSSVRMDYWREYFRSADANIFEIIEGAIMLAASDCPKEFKARRDTIAQILYTCKLIKCSGCDREELALPVDNNEEYNDHHDHDHDHGDDGDEGVKYKSNLSDANVNYSKESSKVINCSRNNDDDDEYENDDDDDDDEHHHDVEANDHVSKYSYGDAEALTDEIEEESQTFNEVLRIKEIVDNSSDESSSVLCNSLRKLQLMAISVETLKATEIGKSVNVLRKHTSKDIRQIARKLIEVWKDMVDEWVDATNKATTVSENTPESINPSVLDEEEGLPSPPLEDLAFLDPHSMSLELNEFFDGMDDYGNLRKSNEFNKNGNNGRKPPVEKQNITKWAQQKPSNGSNMAPKPDVVKPSRPPVFDATPRRRTPNVDRKLQNLEKPTSPNGPVTPQQRKLMSSNEEIEKDKLEATKRKLQERYQQAEKAKKQRTIQVMELHDLPKQNVLTKNQHTRPGSNHNRNRMHGRF